MTPVLSDRYIRSRYAGLDVYRARKKLFSEFPLLENRQVDIRYVESPYPRFTVLASSYDEAKKRILLEASSGNPIRHLPSNYQNNQFLRGFLLIFQHIMNDTVITLDNMHEYFRPMESPTSFLPVLADWLGIHLDSLGGEAEVRRFLQYAIPLYRFRGTVRGLRAHLAIVSGVVPDIIEGKNPYTSYVIRDDAVIEANLFEAGNDNSFTVLFPVPRRRFDDTLVRRLSLIIQREKPVHTRAYLGFKDRKKAARVITTIDTATYLGKDGGISV
jgi:phage tail-like protein